MDTAMFYDDCAYLPEWPGPPIGDEEGRIIHRRWATSVPTQADYQAQPSDIEANQKLRHRTLFSRLAMRFVALIKDA